MKKRLTRDEEFQIMKMVLDKFLWLGFGIMVFGLYKMINAGVTTGIAWMITGAIVLVLFMLIIVREYEVIN